MRCATQQLCRRYSMQQNGSRCSQIDYTAPRMTALLYTEQMNHSNSLMLHCLLCLLITAGCYRVFSTEITAPASSSYGVSPSSFRGTAVVMLNMGGPSTVPEVGPFLRRLFADREIVDLGKWQQSLGAFIASRRTSKVEQQYQQIGGSPIRRWTEIQGQQMCTQLDGLSPGTAPHHPYIMFRYADPLTEDTLLQMKQDGIQRAIAFVQYPQFSCTTSGSSLNHLWRELYRLQLQDMCQWSVIDRWHTHHAFIDAIVQRIEAALGSKFHPQERDKVVIVFSAHSLPMKVVNRGDPYPAEVAATVAAVMKRLQTSRFVTEGQREKANLYATPPNPYVLSWQSQVNKFVLWLGPNTSSTITNLARQGHRHLLLVPIAFTSDHIETLYELDIEYARLAKQAGVVEYHRTESLNDSPLFITALASIVRSHILAGYRCSKQYALNCVGCMNPVCRSIVNPIRKDYQKLRDTVWPTAAWQPHKEAAVAAKAQ